MWSLKPEEELNPPLLKAHSPHAWNGATELVNALVWFVLGKRVIAILQGFLLWIVSSSLHFSEFAAYVVVCLWTSFHVQHHYQMISAKDSAMAHIQGLNVTPPSLYTAVAVGPQGSCLNWQGFAYLYRNRTYNLQTPHPVCNYCAVIVF